MFHSILTAPCPRQHGIVVNAGPIARAFPHGAAAAERGLAEYILVRRVVTDHPVAPERRHGVDVEGDAAPALRTSAGTGRSWIEGLPTVAGKIRFHPGVRIFGAHHIVAGEVVELVAAESVDHARGNSHGAQHDSHGGSEVFAMSLLALEKKI